MWIHGEAFFKSCDKCLHHKSVGKPQHGILPLMPALKAKIPLEKVYVHCAGPWTVQIRSNASKDKIEHRIQVMSMVDARTGWLELALIPSTNSRSYANQFDMQWLCCYSQPTECGHDNGGEFISEVFQELLISYDIKSKPTTVKTPLLKQSSNAFISHFETIFTSLSTWRTTGKMTSNI